MSGNNKIQFVFLEQPDGTWNRVVWPDGAERRLDTGRIDGRYRPIRVGITAKALKELEKRSDVAFFLSQNEKDTYPKFLVVERIAGT